MGSGSSKPPPSARSERSRRNVTSHQRNVKSATSSRRDSTNHVVHDVTITKSRDANSGQQGQQTTEVGNQDLNRGSNLAVGTINNGSDQTTTRPNTGKSISGDRSKSKKRRKKTDIPETWELLTYLPPYGQEFEFSHAHFLYTNDINRLEDLPPPHTAPSRKHEIFDPEAYTTVDERTDALKDVDLEKSCTDLVRMLTADYDDDVSKVRAIYRWFTSQPLERTDYKKNARPESTMFQLWHLKNKRNTYAGVFSVLCAYANIPCCIIRGYLKGSTYEVGQKINKDLHRGEWNAVLVDGNWRFINSFWGACVLSGDDEDEADQELRTQDKMNLTNNGPNHYYYTCDENFFLTDPQQLIYTHFPEEDAWQLLDNKKSIREFETMVFLKDRFFNLEMRVLSHPDCHAEAKDGEIDIIFGLHTEKSMNHTFLCIPTEFVENKKQSKCKPIELPQKNVQLDFIHRPNENVLSIKVRFPKVGVYKLEIVGKDVTINKPDYDYDWVAIYKVNVPFIPEKQTFFPVLEQAGWGPGKLLSDFGLAPLSHENAVIKMNQPGVLPIKFKIIDQNKFKKANIMHKMIRIGDDDADQDIGTFNVNGNVLETSVNVEPGEFKLKISHVFGVQGNEKNICNYHIVCNPPANAQRIERTPTPIDDTDELKEKLRKAVEAQDLELLERAVDLVESKGYAHKLGAELREAKDLIARLKRLQKLLHEVMTLNQRTIAEIKSYSQPKEEIFTVMRGTLILLGHSEEELKDWKNVQALIGKTGKMSLKRRIQEVNVNKLSEEVVRKAKSSLRDIKLEDIVIISAGAATFYSWSTGITEEFDQRQKGN